jgi:hypothetical protein
MIPVYGFVRGDTIGLLMLAEPEETVGNVARRLQRAASVRVPEKENFKIIFNGAELEPDLPVRDAGFHPLDRFDVV